ncbi:MAG: hypothetical protein ACRDJU_10715 [Actinomycetota bacterium]
MRTPSLRRLTGIAWMTAISLCVPMVVAIVDGLVAGHARHAMLPDFFATFATIGLPISAISLFAGAIGLRRAEPTLAPVGASYPKSRRLGGLIMGIGALISVVEVACFEFWPGKQNPRWFGSVAGLCGAFVLLSVALAIFVGIKERRMALGVWTDPRALWDRLRDIGGSPDPAVAVYYGRGPEASLNA